MYYHLNLDCDKSTTNGDFEPYSNTGGPPWNPPNNPEGQVWWQSPDNQATTWAPVPVPGSNQSKAGDPKHAHPVLHAGDQVAICVRDKNNPIAGVSATLVFGRRSGHANQAPIASPFQNTTGGANNTYDQTILTSNGVSGNEEFFVCQLTPVAYPHGGNVSVNFSCYIGVTVIYADGTPATVRQFGMDPEMDVSDYDASPEPAAARTTG